MFLAVTSTRKQSWQLSLFRESEIIWTKVSLWVAHSQEQRSRVHRRNKCPAANVIKSKPQNCVYTRLGRRD